MSNHGSKSCNNSVGCLLQEERLVPCRVLPFVCFVLMCPLLLVIVLGVQVYSQRSYLHLHAMSNHRSKSGNNSVECLVQEGRVVPCRVLPFVCFVLLSGVPKGEVMFGLGFYRVGIGLILWRG